MTPLVVLGVNRLFVVDSILESLNFSAQAVRKGTN